MVMKITSFLRCSVVMALSLVAGRSGAQTDSVIVKLHFVGHDHSRFIATQYQFWGQQNWNPGPNEWLIIPWTADFYFRTQNADTILDTIKPPTMFDGIIEFETGAWIAFTIDTAASKLRKVSLRFDTSENDNMVGFFEVTFDSIPFIRNGNQLSAIGSLPVDYLMGGWVSGPLDFPGRTSGYVGLFDTSGQEEDSLDIEISPINTAVVSSQSTMVSELLLEWNSTTNSITVNFPFSKLPGILTISDLWGRANESIPVPVGIESLQIPNNLPPGLYFARLGDQVAKFVVPPR